MITLRTKPKALTLGRDIATGETVKMLRELLATHLHVLGPPGSGKTRLVLSLFRQLYGDTQSTTILFNVITDSTR